LYAVDALHAVAQLVVAAAVAAVAGAAAMSDPPITVPMIDARTPIRIPLLLVNPILLIEIRDARATDRFCSMGGAFRAARSTPPEMPADPLIGIPQRS
jgi:hypothetical protein